METDFWGALRAVLNIAAPAATIAAPILIAVSVYLASRDKKRRKDDPERRPSRLPAVLVIAGIGLAVLMNLLYFAASVKYYAAREQRVADAPSFTITSENLHDGVWDTVIGKEQGENKSPQLSWEPVEGANAYGILMMQETGCTGRPAWSRPPASRWDMPVLTPMWDPTRPPERPIPIRSMLPLSGRQTRM